MIDIFFRKPSSDPIFHPRTIVTTAPDIDRALALTETLVCAGIAVGGRPSGRHGTISNLIAIRDGRSNIRRLAKFEKQS